MAFCRGNKEDADQHKYVTSAPQYCMVISSFSSKGHCNLKWSYLKDGSTSWREVKRQCDIRHTFKTTLNLVLGFTTNRCCRWFLELYIIWEMESAKNWNEVRKMNILLCFIVNCCVKPYMYLNLVKKGSYSEMLHFFNIWLFCVKLYVLYCWCNDAQQWLSNILWNNVNSYLIIPDDKIVFYWKYRTKPCWFTFIQIK